MQHLSFLETLQICRFRGFLPRLVTFSLEAVALTDRSIFVDQGSSIRQEIKNGRNYEFFFFPTNYLNAFKCHSSPLTLPKHTEAWALGRPCSTSAKLSHEFQDRRQSPDHFDRFWQNRLVRQRPLSLAFFFCGAAFRFTKGGFTRGWQHVALRQSGSRSLCSLYWLTLTCLFGSVGAQSLVLVPGFR